eukprot:TRINITY_DN241_c0_g2_i2.p1 TRINITY_DN241_c0_g2~~TRINITY_DN241_c0_g2_i2.p1  ORF type:complete len:114 (+),score=45.87 TRINITY_DN241_c0_g2_i2:51-392(+)
MSYKGEVVTWNRKGFGFIKSPDFEEDIFVHFSSFGGGDLIVGRSVNFNLEDDSRGAKRRARDVEGEAIEKNGPPARDDRDRGYGGGRDRYDDRDRRDSRDRGYDRRRDSRDRY